MKDLYMITKKNKKKKKKNSDKWKEFCPAPIKLAGH